jgi:peptidoglycan hydrolase-like protein with peptidoglycan-binding domain
MATPGKGERMRRCVLAALVLLGMLGSAVGVASAAPPSKNPTGAAAARKAGRAQEVARAAVALKKLGLYQGDVSGKWCPELHEAIRAFQKSHGLKVSGRLNRDTRVALGLEEAQARPGRSREPGGDKAAEAP